jgi:epoxyqueuosine reductase QueG
MPDPILTDLPLVPDAPVDIGVEDFCKICRKCANTCPTNSIPFGDKVVHNGIEIQNQLAHLLQAATVRS